MVDVFGSKLGRQVEVPDFVRALEVAEAGVLSVAHGFVDRIPVHSINKVEIAEINGLIHLDSWARSIVGWGCWGSRG